jgi:hypothetical protein
MLCVFRNIVLKVVALNIFNVITFLKLFLYVIYVMFPPFNALCYQMSVSGRDNFYMLINYIVLSQYIGS